MDLKAMFELEELKQKSLAVKLGILPVYGEEDVKVNGLFGKEFGLRGYPLRPFPYPTRSAGSRNRPTDQFCWMSNGPTIRPADEW